MSHYQKLTQHFKKISHFQHLASICGWDQATMMPSGGNDARAEAMAELALHVHQLSTAPQLGEWLNNAANETLEEIQHANLREMTLCWQQATVIPEDLVQAKSLAGSKCEHAWRNQRNQNDWQGFSKNFAAVVSLSQQEAQIRAQANQTTPYDAMLNLYEPGVTTAQLDVVFNKVKAWLPELTQTIIAKQASESFIAPQGHFATEQQRALGLKVMSLLGFDFEQGRLDVSSHPFCGGVPSDVRITTRYDETDFVQSLMGIVHETGHARYEQGLPKQLAGQPAGLARSMGIHESQSLFFEMQLGRSAEFIKLLAPLAAAHFPAIDAKVFAVDNLQKIYTRVQPGLIRVDADEVTYPAHVMLRYEIERDLINQTITYQDIPELWQQKMQAYLGLDTSGDYKNGCMQDIHWTDGSFGYFPSYSLGAMYGAQFMAKMNQEFDVASAVASQNLTPIFNWLNQHIWQKGSTLSTNDLVINATGEPLNSDYFKQHLITRYL
ncbi:carboxypeptidase M32 [Pseudoalteromonas tunicata]|uniref:Metal-dependent carboxypeptidase n=1 Tax=Pseudoalteromonas tunicata D2 TaxID=87626 RepID=A4CCS8_9GAMM|nr:carboxypeptidase M32 [Pseudoalteromonas tunicata]ATC93875.1 carboxypeptidase Taq [Pseudoalteromonas tunicata]AXT29680.1 carboxypeptidase M32 [Pseudoalteromonas tunicata]EAR27371.1 thermostable carboxypeptidase 1 [Pseudoalteromonas tunicata D2]